jgi:hypothetical protein
MDRIIFFAISTLEWIRQEGRQKGKQEGKLADIEPEVRPAS